MNLSASVTFLAALTAINNQSNVHEPGVSRQARSIRCFNCGAYVDDRTWCNNPTEDNAPADGIEDCFYDHVCAKSVYTDESAGCTVVERRCSFESACDYIIGETDITVKRCDTCYDDLCNGNDGAKCCLSRWLLVELMLTIALNLML